VKFVDSLIRPRCQWLFGEYSARIVAAVCCVIAATMPPLELVPFLAFVPAFAIALFGLGLSAKDGLLVMVAGALALTGIIFSVVKFL